MVMMSEDDNDDDDDCDYDYDYDYDDDDVSDDYDVVQENWGWVKIINSVMSVCVLSRKLGLSENAKKRYVFLCAFKFSYWNWQLWEIFSDARVQLTHWEVACDFDAHLMFLKCDIESNV